MTDELAKQIVRGLKDAGINFVTYLPETRLSQIVPLIRDDPDMELIAAYCREVVAVIKPLRPLLIYFHQDDVDSAIRAVSAQRGDKWVNYQANWKLQ